MDAALRSHGYYADPDAVMVEKQQSAIDEVPLSVQPPERCLRVRMNIFQNRSPDC